MGPPPGTLNRANAHARSGGNAATREQLCLTVDGVVVGLPVLPYRPTDLEDALPTLMGKALGYIPGYRLYN